jgi:hypothetical protein
MRTVNQPLKSATVYIISTFQQYNDYMIKLLHDSYLYNIIVESNINKIEKGSIMILINTHPSDAAIYSIIAENNNGLLIYIHTNGSYCHIICDMKTDIEKKCKEIFNMNDHPLYVVKMICGFVVTNIIKYIYDIGKIGNFKWSDTINISNMCESPVTHIQNNNVLTFHTYINKFKGSIQSILPYITSKDITIKTYEKTYPICIIENKPTTIEHLVEWIRDKINSYELNNSRHETFMILFNKNIKELQSIFPDYNIKIMEPVGELYEQFIKADNIMDYIVVAIKIRAHNYNIIIPTNETIIDIYNMVDPTLPSMISFVDGLCEIEMMKFIHSPNNNFYTWDIDMIENKIVRNDIVTAKEIEINGITYNEWHTFTYNNIDATLEDMIIDLNIMYGTFITIIIYDKSIIYSDNINIDNDIDINIKTLFMDRFNIDIMKESIILELFGTDDALLPLKIEKAT